MILEKIALFAGEIVAPAQSAGEPPPAAKAITAERSQLPLSVLTVDSTITGSYIYLTWKRKMHRNALFAHVKGKEHCEN
jgi:hypothetical protein